MNPDKPRTVPDEDNRRWGWHVEDDQQAIGDFSSRDEAICDALNNEDTGTVILVGRCSPIDPGLYVNADPDLVLEDVEENAFDDTGGAFDECIFRIPDPEKAETALRAALASWAREYINCEHWMLTDCERVVLDVLTF